ncbi:hypothetical protein FRC01_014609, partial [Tulasnella sp. 417]
MESHQEHYQGFVEDDKSWRSYIEEMRLNGTYGGHLELSAFAHLMRRNVKVIQPGLVYVIEWRTGPNAPGASTANHEEDEDNAGSSVASTSAAAASASQAQAEGSGLSSREARKARRDRLKDAKEEERRRKKQSESREEDDDDAHPSSASAPPDQDLPAVYVA